MTEAHVDLKGTATNTERPPAHDRMSWIEESTVAQLSRNHQKTVSRTRGLKKKDHAAVQLYGGVSF